MIQFRLQVDNRIFALTHCTHKQGNYITQSSALFAIFGTFLCQILPKLNNFFQKSKCKHHPGTRRHLCAKFDILKPTQSGDTVWRKKAITHPHMGYVIQTRSLFQHPRPHTEKRSYTFGLHSYVLSDITLDFTTAAYLHVLKYEHLQKCYYKSLVYV